MQLQIFPDYISMSRAAAESALQEIQQGLQQGNFVLGLPTGATPKGFYQELLGMFATHPGMDLQHFYTFNLDQYYPMNKDDPHSYYAEMLAQFWAPLSQINSTFDYQKQAFMLDGEAKDPASETKEYEAKIKNLGGINLQILGIGVNGHIGFNEPGSTQDSRTRLVQLTTSTIEINAAKFFAGDTTKVPHQALSMGMGTILEAKKVFLLVSGASKSPILQETYHAKQTYMQNPASFLIEHPAVTIFTDQEAASGC
jgi:glucosamine-6-phosphate deaminase